MTVARALARAGWDLHQDMAVLSLARAGPELFATHRLDFGVNGGAPPTERGSSILMEQDTARPLRSTATHRVVWIGGDGGGSELFLDLDDWFGKGRCAVLTAAEGSPDVRFVASDFPAAIERAVAGPKLDTERALAKARPSPEP
jgi:hypothetical protein